MYQGAVTNPNTNPNTNTNTNPNTNPNTIPNTNPNTNPNDRTARTGGGASTIVDSIRSVTPGTIVSDYFFYEQVF